MTSSRTSTSFGGFSSRADSIGSKVSPIRIRRCPASTRCGPTWCREESPPDKFVPIVILTGDDSLAARERALTLGATDFIGKPFHDSEVLLRIRNLLETRFLHLLLHDEKALLQRRVEEQSRELMKAQSEVLERLGQAAEFRDDDTGHHSQRVAEVSARLGRVIGLKDERVGILRRAAPLHDIGKIGIPDRILLKPGALTPEEFAVMKTPPLSGPRCWRVAPRS
jgi:putative two-component system response regulator